MKQKQIISAMLLVAATVVAQAAPLTPEQALEAVRGSVAAGPMRAKANNMKLAYTFERNRTATVYVFAPENPANGGYIVASADDQSVPLLGYSETGTFDPAGMPPQMINWLGSYGPKQSMPRAAHAVISPLCATKWDQDAPYYNQCPTIRGQRCVTGCVATAMAQVMKVQEWPVTGTGTHSYTFTYNGSNYTDSFNFGATTFDWDNMLDSYSGSSTTAQKNAVATLMHACGVASDMKYSPDGSGAMEYVAAAGMIDFLGYDAGTAAMNREWYTADAWDNLVYNELAAGRAVMYAGMNSSNEGHEFVCDGYNGSGYYHFNWGWSGAYDGYFLLADPNPTGTGIGGGSGSSGFKYMMTAIVGAKPAEEGSIRPILIGGTDITTNKNSYSRNNSTSVRVNSADYFYNYSTFDVTVSFGMVLTGDGTAPTFIAGETKSLPMLNDFKYYEMTAGSFPIGNWKAFPAVSADNGETWTLIKFDASLCKGYFDVEVTSSSVKFSKGTQDIEGPQAGPEPTVIEIDWTSKSPDDEALYLGSKYDLIFNFSANNGFSEVYKAVLVDSKVEGEINPDPVTEGFEGATAFSSSVDGWTFVDKDGGAVGSPKDIDIPGITSGSTKGSWWVWDFGQLGSDSFTPHSGEKYIFNMYNLNGSTNSDWAISPELSGDAQTISLYAKSYTSSYGLESFKIYTSTGSVDPANFTLVSGSLTNPPAEWTKYQFNLPAGAKRFAIECCSTDVFMLFIDDITYTPAKEAGFLSVPVARSEALEVVSEDGTPFDKVFSLSIPKNLDTATNERYQLHLCKVEDGSYKTVKFWPVNVAKNDSGIDSLTDDDSAPVYFDLMGRRIAKPQPGSVCIEKSANGTRKVIGK